MVIFLCLVARREQQICHLCRSIKRSNSAFDQAMKTWQPWPQHVPLALLWKIDYCKTLSSWRVWKAAAILTGVQFDYLLFFHTKPVWGGLQKSFLFCHLKLVIVWLTVSGSNVALTKPELRISSENVWMCHTVLIYLYCIFSGSKNVKIYCRNIIIYNRYAYGIFINKTIMDMGFCVCIF